MFCLFYDAKKKQVHALNGSGRSPAKIDVEAVRQEVKGNKNPNEIPHTNVHSVTVPGAACGWVDTVERFGSGRLTMAEILAPAIELAESGFPVSELASGMVGDFPYHR